MKYKLPHRLSYERKRLRFLILKKCEQENVMLLSDLTFVPIAYYSIVCYDIQWCSDQQI